MAVTYGRGCCKWAVWWAVSVASLLALVQGQPQNCTVEYRQHFLCNITRGEMCPLVERVSESWPPPPSKFSVGSFMDEFVQKNTTFLVPGLKFTWKPPPNSGYKSVTGFEMNLIIASGKHTNKQECFTFRLSDEIPDLETTFEYSIFPVKYTTRYVVQLYSLPKPDPNYSADNFVMESILTPRFIQKDHPVPSTWKFGMNKGVDVCKAEIYCSFTIPPKSLNITAVDVGLLKKGQANYFEIKRVVFANNHHTAAFEDVPPGEYQIQLTVVDDYHHDPQRCVCRNHKGQCDTCVVTVSEYFNMSSNRSGCPTTTAPTTFPPTTLESTTFNSSTSSVASPSVGQSSTTDPEDQTVKYVGVALGLVIAVLLIVLLIFILRRKGVMCCGNKDDYFSGDNKPPIPPTTTANIINNNNNNKALEALKPFLRERVIYLVYSDDNAYHQKVVKAFARYLSAQCKCVVRYPRWCLPEIRSQGTINWVLQSIQEADFVLIVNSEGAFRLNEARKEGTTPCQFNNSSIGDIFTPAIQNVIGNFYKRQAYDKYIMMQFSYSDDKFQIGEISPGYKYTLIKHFRELLCHIHNINTEKPGAVSQSLPLHPDDHERTVEGRELLQAVREATAFTKSYPDWYSAMYSPDDDCYDSGLGSVPVDSFPDFMQEEIHQSCAENQQRMEAIHRKNLLNGDVGHSFVPTQRNDDLLSVTQSQVTMAPPMDLYSLFTDLGQDGREAGICETGGYMGGPVDHTCLMSQTSCGHTDSGHGSQRSNASQQSHPGIFNMQAMLQCPDNFIPPADMDSVSWGSQYEAMHNAMMDQGFPTDHQGPVVDASVFDNISVDAMSV